MKKTLLLSVLLSLLLGLGVVSGQDTTEITIATVNNPDMQVMEGFTDEFESAYPNITLNWVVLPENELRNRVTTDVATGASSFDVVTVGTYEVPIWAENGWIQNVDQLMEENADFVQPDYNKDDLLAPIRQGLSYEDSLYALPFYGESSMLFYNTEIFEEAGVEMPEEPTWEEVREIACELHDPDNDQYGIVLRGLPGWGQILGPMNTVVNTFGGRWFDMDWEPQLTDDEFVEATEFYVNLIRDCGEPGASSVGFTEALTLMSQGQAAMWYDATVAAGFLSDPDQSQISETVGFAPAPVGPFDTGNNWLWSWSLTIPSTSESTPEALQFITWATSRDYIELVASENGWGSVPPGTRLSTYETEEYLEAAPFAELVLEMIQDADPTSPTVEEVPYTGVQFVGIPEFQSIGTQASQFIADAIAGNITVREALEQGQELVREEMEAAGYYD